MFWGAAHAIFNHFLPIQNQSKVSLLTKRLNSQRHDQLMHKNTAALRHAAMTWHDHQIDSKMPDMNSFHYLRRLPDDACPFLLISPAAGLIGPPKGVPNGVGTVAPSGDS